MNTEVAVQGERLEDFLNRLTACHRPAWSVRVETINAAEVSFLSCSCGWEGDLRKSVTDNFLSWHTHLATALTDFTTAWDPRPSQSGR